MSRFSKVLSHDPDSRITTIYHTEDEGESHWLEKIQDVSGVAELNKAAFNSVDERAPWKGELHHVAEIPLTVLLQYPFLDPGSPQYDEKKAKAWLNDRDNLVFRVRPGRV